MDTLEQLKQLSSYMDLEPAEDVGCPKVSTRDEDIYLSKAVLPNGQHISLLKTLLTSACERNCYYCPFRAGRDFRRATFKPEDLAKTYKALYNAGIAEGIFLSSGVVGGGIRTQDQLIKTAEILRYKLDYRGYLHLKIMPGAEKTQVFRSMQLADRISINLEAPNTHRLQKLAPRKQFIDELIQPLRWVEEIRHTQHSRLGWNGRWPSSVTQFVVGGVGENDLELLSTTQHLYHELHLSRTYYSAFRPFPDTPMDHLPAESKQREHRLYQASFLLRDYGFDLEELPLNHGGDLPLNIDPKLAWARQTLTHQPIDINHADKRDLLRIPGIGPKGTQAILTYR
ncbi:MAG: radical SAM protein, partial [Anaerolineales bacterium]|nr:radical SAM protein [Anaerolineales bacterium]